MTTSKKNNPLLQNIALVLIIFVAAAGGMYLGVSLNKPTEQIVSDTNFNTFESLILLPDSTFPNVQLLDKSSHTVGSQSLLYNGETIVIFIDAECPPCHDIALHYKKLIDDNTYLPEQIVAISFNDYGYLESFIDSNELPFSVYTDPEFAFMQKYGIDAYPFVMHVNSEGVITETSSDSNNILNE